MTSFRTPALPLRRTAIVAVGTVGFVIAFAFALGPSALRSPGLASAPAPAAQAARVAPRDGRGWVLRAYEAYEAERYAEAADAFERAVALAGTVAADPGVWCDWADALGMAQGGRLAGRPTELVQRALALRANHPKALEMAGSAAYERRDYAAAVRHWRALDAQLDAGTQQQQALAAAIERAQRLAATSLPAAR